MSHYTAAQRNGEPWAQPLPGYKGPAGAMRAPGQWCVVQYRHGVFDAVMSGMGKNRGTLDSDHSRRSAQRHAAALRADNVNQWRTDAGLTYRVETCT